MIYNTVDKNIIIHVELGMFMWSQLLYIFLLLTCPNGQVKDHLIEDDLRVEAVICGDAIEYRDEVCALCNSEIEIHYLQHVWMPVTVRSQFDLPGDYNISGNIACRTLLMSKKVLSCNIDLSLHASQYLRHLSSYYDSGIYILMRKLVI